MSYKNGERITITPEIAKAFLKKNKTNRPLSMVWVKRYADRMNSGDWVFNGDSIKFDINDYLIDGQHRLTACVFANYDMPAIVLYDLPENAFHTIDEGKKRNAADIFAIENEKHYKLLASTLRLIDHYKIKGFIPNKGGGKDLFYSNTQMLVLLDKYPATRDSVAFAAIYRKTFNYAFPSIIAFCHYIFKAESEEDANNFFRLLASGAGLNKYNPILKLRDRLIFLKAIKDKNYGTSYITNIIIKAWKLYRTNTKVKRLVIDYTILNKRNKGGRPKKKK